MVAVTVWRQNFIIGLSHKIIDKGADVLEVFFETRGNCMLAQPAFSECVARPGPKQAGA